jgi:WD40 repeat protein
LWDLVKAKELCSFDNGDRPDYLVISPDQRTFLSTSFKKVKMWDVETGKLAKSFEDHPFRVKGVSYGPDKTMISVSAGKKGIKTWELATEKCTREVGDEGFLIESFAASPDSRAVLIGGDNEMRLIGVENGAVLGHWKKLDGGIRVAFAPNGKAILFGDGAGVLHLLELPNPDKKTSEKGEEKEQKGFQAAF